MEGGEEEDGRGEEEEAPAGDERTTRKLERHNGRRFVTSQRHAIENNKRVKLVEKLSLESPPFLINLDLRHRLYYSMSGKPPITQDYSTVKVILCFFAGDSAGSNRMTYTKNALYSCLFFSFFFFRLDGL